MAIQSTMGPAGDVYVTKTAFYWSIGIIILLLAAISFSTAKDISRLSVSGRGVTVERTEAPPADDLPPLPPDVRPDSR